MKQLDKEWRPLLVLPLGLGMIWLGRKLQQWDHRLLQEYDPESRHPSRRSPHQEMEL